MSAASSPTGTDRFQDWLLAGLQADRIAAFNRDDDEERREYQRGSELQAYFICLRTPPTSEDIDVLRTNGFEQDPDVLDTWFSSALWPISTMGWPEETALLAKFNPTNVLCTAREIITLWVSRMVMFNTYFRDRLPFTDVFIHAMIQDGEGRKMSKSLGNGVDPRDIIRSRGADAMRFTLANMATQTQDVRMPVEYDASIKANTSPKFELGGRLGNKLWNATRFALTALGQATADSDDAGERMLIDRWILSRLARATRAIEQAIGAYEFNVYSQTLYDLFWREVCDWYLEGIKPTVRGSSEQCRILATVLRAVHRLFHPVMPFMTEELFEAVEGTGWPSVEGVELKEGALAATARWPIVSDALIDQAAEDEFVLVQELVSAMREIRSAQLVADRKRIVLHISDDSTAELIGRAGGVVEVLAGLETVTRDPAPGDSVPFVFGHCEHALSGLRNQVDTDAERTRIARQRDELVKRVGALNGRLGNRAYVSKAPAKLVEETREQLSQAQAELESLEQALARLEGG